MKSQGMDAIPRILINTAKKHRMAASWETNMRKGMKKLIAVMLLAGTIMSILSANAMAAYCGVAGSCKGSTTFDVTTKCGVGQSVTIKPTTPGQLWMGRDPVMFFEESWANYKITTR